MNRPYSATKSGSHQHQQQRTKPHKSKYSNVASHLYASGSAPINARELTVNDQKIVQLARQQQESQTAKQRSEQPAADVAPAAAADAVQYGKQEVQQTKASLKSSSEEYNLALAEYRINRLAEKRAIRANRRVSKGKGGEKQAVALTTNIVVNPTLVKRQKAVEHSGTNDAVEQTADAEQPTTTATTADAPAQSPAANDVTADIKITKPATSSVTVPPTAPSQPPTTEPIEPKHPRKKDDSQRKLERLKRKLNRQQTATCLTADHIVLTRSGWKPIASVIEQVDYVRSFNTETYDTEWSLVTAINAHLRNAANEADRLWRMSALNIDVVATGNHRMLVIRTRQSNQAERRADGHFMRLASTPDRPGVDYETMQTLSTHNFTAGVVGKYPSNRLAPAAGFNMQPHYELSIQGIERICAYWWQRDKQCNLLEYFGFWLGDGGLSRGEVLSWELCIKQSKSKEAVDYVRSLHKRVFNTWFRETWSWITNKAGKRVKEYRFYVRCPPLVKWLQPMLRGPLGYEPRDPQHVQNYPVFAPNNDLMALEAQHHYAFIGTGGHYWTEDAMLAAVQGQPVASRRSRKWTVGSHAAARRRGQFNPSAEIKLVDTRQPAAHDNTDVVSVSSDDLNLEGLDISSDNECAPSYSDDSDSDSEDQLYMPSWLRSLPDLALNRASSEPPPPPPVVYTDEQKRVAAEVQERVAARTAAEQLVQQVNAANYHHRLAADNLQIVPIEKDGNCLFASLCWLTRNGDVSDHMSLRWKIVNYIRDRLSFYKPMIDNIDGSGHTANQYLRNMDKAKWWGGGTELEVAAILLRRDIDVYEDTSTQVIHIKSRGDGAASTRPLLRLSRVDSSHYQVLVKVPAAGTGATPTRSPVHSNTSSAHSTPQKPDVVDNDIMDVDTAPLPVAKIEPAVRACAVCKRTDGNIQRCSACKQIWYCGEEHQRSHWPVHILDCTVVANAPVAEPPGSQRSASADAPRPIYTYKAPDQLEYRLHGKPLLVHGKWYYTKRWMNPAYMTQHFCKLSRRQAAALLIGFGKADGRWDSIQHQQHDAANDGISDEDEDPRDDHRWRPIGSFVLSNSSLPLIHHLMMMVCLAEGQSSVHRQKKAGERAGNAMVKSDAWTMRVMFERPDHIPHRFANMSRPLDVNADATLRGHVPTFADTNTVYELTVQGNHNFLVCRQSLKMTTKGVVPAGGRKQTVYMLPVYVGNCHPNVGEKQARMEQELGADGAQTNGEQTADSKAAERADADLPASKANVLPLASSAAKAALAPTSTSQHQQHVAADQPHWVQQGQPIHTDKAGQQHTMSVDDLHTQLHYDPAIVAVLQQHDIHTLFATQSAVIPLLTHVGSRHDFCVTATTGSGKTLTYVLPILHALSKHIVRQLRCVVVLPTRDLAKQVYSVFNWFSQALNLNIGTAIGQQSFEMEQEALTDPLTGQPAIDVLICTPGRLIDHLTKTPQLTLSYLQYLVLDETDRLLTQTYSDFVHLVLTKVDEQYGVPTTDDAAEDDEQGVKLDEHGLPVYQLTAPRMLRSTHTSGATTLATINSQPQSSCKLQKLLFSATLTADPQKLAALHLYQPLFFSEVKRGFVEKHESDSSKHEALYSVPSTLTEHMVLCNTENKPMKLLCLLHRLMDTNTAAGAIARINEEHSHKPQILIFTSNLESTHRLARLLELYIPLSTLDCSLGEYSSNLSQHQRSTMLKQFRSNQLQVLVCSDAMARGMDIESVGVVINYDSPQYVQTYIHRVGRTARAAQQGTAYTLVRSNEKRYFKALLRQVTGSQWREQQIEHTHIPQLTSNYATALHQLQQVIGLEGKHEVDASKALTERVRDQLQRNQPNRQLAANMLIEDD